MRRIMSAILLPVVFALCVLCAPGYTRAAEDSQSEANIKGAGESQTAVTLLSALEIIDPGESFRGAESLTRGELLSDILRMIGMDDHAIPPAAEQIFLDVSLRHPYAGQIAFAYRSNIITGNPDGTFEPDKPVTLTEGVAFAIKALRFDPLAAELGGYPAGYLQTAARFGLLKKVSADAGGYLTRASAAQLLFNALDCRYSAPAGGAAKYEISAGNSLLQTVFNLYETKGIVEANQLGQLYGDRIAPKGSIVIGGQTYLAGSEYSAAYLGWRITAYYRDESGEKRILAIDAGRNEVSEFDSRKVISFTPGTIRYLDENGREQKMDVDANAVTLENYAPISLLAAGAALPAQGSLSTVDNNADGLADVALIARCDLIVAGYIDAESRTVYNGQHPQRNNPLHPGSRYSLGDYRAYSIQSASGKEMALSDLAADDVLEIYAAPDYSRIRMVVVREQRSVTVTQLSEESEGGFPYLELTGSDGAVYRTTPLFTQIEGGGALGVGGKYMFALSSKGEIAAILNRTAAELSYGYLCRWGMKKGVSQTAQLKLYTVSGNFILTHTAGRVRLKSEGMSMSVTPDALLARITAPQLVRYRLDQDGALVEIEFPHTDAAASGTGFRRIGELTETTDSNSTRYYTRSGLIGGKILVGGKTAVMVVPSADGIDDEEQFAVTDMSGLTDQAYYHSSAGYTSASDTLEAELLLLTYRPPAMGRFNPTILVTKITDAYDPVTQAFRKKVYGYLGGKETSYYISAKMGAFAYLPPAPAAPEPVPVEPGDVIKLALDLDGSIRFIRPLFDASLQKLYWTNSGMSAVSANQAFNYSVDPYGNENRSNYGIPYRRIDNSLKIIDLSLAPTQPPAAAVPSPEIYRLNNLTYLYEFDGAKPAGRQARVIGQEEIMTYEVNPELSSRIFLYLNSSATILAVVYR